jgi:ADP-dependent NAD(P)H-hydrate dehydratase / NAD(P)H-hydrate epimerase
MRWKIRNDVMIKAQQTMIEPHQYTDDQAAARLLKPRSIDAHKGDMGHAALLAGSFGMLGAAILAAKGCMRCGAGKLTIFAEPASYPILQGALPEAIFQIAEFKDWSTHLGAGKFNSVGYGPGLGRPRYNENLIRALFDSGHPMVLDADGLNQLATAGQELIELLPPLSILTPHAAEYNRLFGSFDSPEHVARSLNIILVNKGRNSRVIGPDGTIFVNMTGNPGLATAGSGDVLTGMILGLLARGYDPLSAARLGVYLHGRSGDLAAARYGEESLMAGDLPNFIGDVYKELTDIVK